MLGILQVGADVRKPNNSVRQMLGFVTSPPTYKDLNPQQCLGHSFRKLFFDKLRFVGWIKFYFIQFKVIFFAQCNQFSDFLYR